jgi:hypothetical protein
MGGSPQPPTPPSRPAETGSPRRLKARTKTRFSWIIRLSMSGALPRAACLRQRHPRGAHRYTPEKIGCKAELARGKLQVPEAQALLAKGCKDVNMVHEKRIWCMTGVPPCTLSIFPTRTGNDKPVQVSDLPSARTGIWLSFAAGDGTIGNSRRGPWVAPGRTLLGRDVSCAVSFGLLPLSC